MLTFIVLLNKDTSLFLKHFSLIYFKSLVSCLYYKAPHPDQLYVVLVSPDLFVNFYGGFSPYPRILST